MTDESYEMPMTCPLGEYCGTKTAKMTTFWFTDVLSHPEPPESSSSTPKNTRLHDLDKNPKTNRGITYVLRSSLDDKKGAPSKPGKTSGSPEHLQDIQEAYVLVPLEHKHGTLVYFFSKFNFGAKVWSIVQDEVSYGRLKNLSNLRHLAYQSQQMNEYDLVNFSNTSGVKSYQLSSRAVQPARSNYQPSAASLRNSMAGGGTGAAGMRPSNPFEPMKR